MESFFSGRAASFQESQPPSLDISAILARPDDSFTFAEVGSKWGYSAGDFDFLLKGDRSNLKRFAVLAVTHDNPPAARPPPEPPDSRLELASIPRSTPPVSTEPDEPFAGSAVGSVPPQFQGTFPFYSVFNDPEGARARVELWESEFAADNERRQGIQPTWQSPMRARPPFPGRDLLGQVLPGSLGSHAAGEAGR